MAKEPTEPRERTTVPIAEVEAPPAESVPSESDATQPPPAQTQQMVRAQPVPPAMIGKRGIEIQNVSELWVFSKAVAASGLAPKGIDRAESIFVAIQMGLEIGLSPMAALQNIAVINGRPSLWGDAMLGVVRACGELELYEEWFEHQGARLKATPDTYDDTTRAVVKLKRRGAELRQGSFSVADAKRAELWGKAGPWKQYPFRMLRFRARAFELRDEFGDVLKGLQSAEEVRDTPAIELTGKEVGLSGVQIFEAAAAAETAIAGIQGKETPLKTRDTQEPEPEKAAEPVVTGPVVVEKPEPEQAKDGGPTMLKPSEVKALRHQVATLGLGQERFHEALSAATGSADETQIPTGAASEVMRHARNILNAGKKK